MKVHVLGNSPSPALRRLLCEESGWKRWRETWFRCKAVCWETVLCLWWSPLSRHIRRNCWSFDTNEKCWQNPPWDKVASNRQQGMEAFPVEDLSKDLKDLELGVDPLPLQRSLGLFWNLETDNFTYTVSQEAKPFTHRGVLSTVSSLYDPLSFEAPMTRQGKALIRELSPEWDAPLSAQKETESKSWKKSLKTLENLQIPRCYVPASLSSTQRTELCILSDASIEAIGAVT